MSNPRPNVLWLFLEDVNPWMSCYGDQTIQTPNIDALATSGVRFDRAYQTSGVCSPSRSATITGMYQTTIGAHNHNSSYPLLPEGIKTIPEYFRDAGYYTFNEGKTHYNFVFELDTLFNHHGSMDFKGAKNGSDWSGCPPGQPFFGQIQLRGGKSIGLLKGPGIDPATVPVPSFYPDHEIIRREIALHYDCILAHRPASGMDFGAIRRRWIARKHNHFFIQRPRDAVAAAQAIYLRRGPQSPIDDFLAGQYRYLKTLEAYAPTSSVALTSVPPLSRSLASMCPITWKVKICLASVSSNATM